MINIIEHTFSQDINHLFSDLDEAEEYVDNRIIHGDDINCLCMVINDKPHLIKVTHH